MAMRWRCDTSRPSPAPRRRMGPRRQRALAVAFRYHHVANRQPGGGWRVIVADASVEIFRARRVISLAGPAAGLGQSPEPEAFAVLGEQIVGAGAADDLRSRFPEATLTDLGDGVVVPGFNDSHIHPSI